jgi:segregation and condensation protein A
MRVDEGIEEDGNLRITLLHLLNTFREVMSREKKRGERTFEVSWEKLSLSKKIKELNEIFKRVREIEFYKLFDGERKIEVIITLLAILELVRLRKVSIHQRAPFSEIWITRKDFSC